MIFSYTNTILKMYNNIIYIHKIFIKILNKFHTESHIYRYNNRFNPLNILKKGVCLRDSRFKRKESYLLSRKLLKFPEEQTPSKRGPFMHKKVFPYRSSRSQNRAKLLRKTIVSSARHP